MSDTRSGLTGAMTTLLHPKHGGCGVASQDGKETVGVGCTINSGNQIRDKNNNENDKHDNNKNNGSDDDKGNHKHTSYVMNKPGIISEKWNNSQACKISDAQPKVYGTRRKKPGGINYSALTKQRIQRVCNALISRIVLSILRDIMRMRRVEP